MGKKQIIEIIDGEGYMAAEVFRRYFKCEFSKISFHIQHKRTVSVFNYCDVENIYMKNENLIIKTKKYNFQFDTINELITIE